MNTVKYLIVAEIENKGFLLKIEDNFEKAESFAQYIYSLSDEFYIYEMDKVEQKLKYFSFYKINGNEIYLKKIKTSISNGVYTVSVVEIDLNNYCEKTFIKERENHSSVFDFEKYPKELDRLAELFSEIDLVAN